MWTKQKRYVRIETHPTPLSPPTPLGITRDVFVRVYSLKEVLSIGNISKNVLITNSKQPTRACNILRKTNNYVILSFKYFPGTENCSVTVNRYRYHNGRHCVVYLKFY